MNSSEGELVAGKSFPWEYITGFYLRLTHFTPVATIDGDTVGSGVMGAYGLASAELPNPDVEPNQRVVRSMTRCSVELGLAFPLLHWHY